MCSSDDRIKCLAALTERVQGFLDDGYHIIINYKSDDLCLVKLRHHNGNRIQLTLRLNDRILEQTTNHVKNYTHKVC